MPLNQMGGGGGEIRRNEILEKDKNKEKLIGERDLKRRTPSTPFQINNLVDLLFIQ